MKCVRESMSALFYHPLSESWSKRSSIGIIWQTSPWLKPSIQQGIVSFLYVLYNQCKRNKWNHSVFQTADACLSTLEVAGPCPPCLPLQPSGFTFGLWKCCCVCLIIFSGTTGYKIHRSISCSSSNAALFSPWRFLSRNCHKIMCFPL